MKTLRYVNLTLLTITICIGLMVIPEVRAEEEWNFEGLIDVDYPNAGKARVEVNLTGTLLTVAAKLVAGEAPEVSDFLARLDALKLRIYDISAFQGKSIDEVMDFYKDTLKKSKWEVMASVRDEESNVGVYSLAKGDVISGMVVIVGSPKEFIIVNLAGEIDITKLAKIDKAAGVHLFGKSILDMKENLPPEKEEKQKE